MLLVTAMAGLVGWQFTKLGSFLLHKIKMEQKIQELKNNTQNLQKIALDQYHGQEEIYFNGHLYDVVSCSKEGNKFVLAVIDDRAEKKMEQLLVDDGEDDEDEDAQTEKSPDWIKEWWWAGAGIEGREVNNLLYYHCNFDSVNIEPEIKPPIVFG